MTPGNRHRPLTITVAGTNGKGSSVAMLEAIYAAAGYSTGVYTTPHVLRYNERIRINQKPVEDAVICAAFAEIDQARGDTSLTYFEFGTLAALLCFAREKVDIQILEVGLGGRLDAVNMVDADAALISTIDLDHAEWLGTDRSQIAVEKAGIFRPHQVAVCSDPTVPQSLIQFAQEIETDLQCAGQHFTSHCLDDSKWTLQGESGQPVVWDRPGLPGVHQIQNAAGVVRLVQRLQHTLPVDDSTIQAGLSQAQLVGRMQRVASDPDLWLDVAHNPESARALAAQLRAICDGRSCIAVFGVMADKDMRTMLEPMLDVVDFWCLVDLPLPRAARAAEIERVLNSIQPESKCRRFSSVPDAIGVAREVAQASDCMVAFGSFHVAEAVLRAL